MPTESDKNTYYLDGCLLLKNTVKPRGSFSSKYKLKDMSVFWDQTDKKGENMNEISSFRSKNFRVDMVRGMSRVQFNGTSGLIKPPLRTAFLKQSKHFFFILILAIGSSYE